jgi:outer membrane protein TolC
MTRLDYSGVRRGFRWRIAVGAAIAFTLAGTAWAEPSPTAGALSLEQALTVARRANRSLVVERARLAQAKTNLEMAWSALFPTVAVQGRYTRNNIAFIFGIPGENGQPTQTLTIQPKDQLDGVASLSLPVIAPPAYAALSAVKASVQASEADYQTSRSNVLLAVAQAYYAAGISDEVVAARESSIQVARMTLQNAQTRFASGAVTRVDVDRAELAVVRAEQSAREARFGVEQAYRALATLLQMDRPFKVAMVARKTITDEPLDLQAALRLRPEFRSLELGVKSLTEQSHAYAWRWSPTLSAFANVHLFNYDNFAQQNHTWAVGLQLDWVLYDGGLRDAQRHIAEAQTREIAARADVFRDAVRDDLANNRGLLDTKRHAQSAAERQVDLAGETLELVRTQYEAGNAAQIDLLQAQDGLTAAKEALAQAHYQVAVTELGLRHAAGTFPGNLSE